MTTYLLTLDRSYYIIFCTTTLIMFLPPQNVTEIGLFVFNVAVVHSLLIPQV